MRERIRLKDKHNYIWILVIIFGIIIFVNFMIFFGYINHKIFSLDPSSMKNLDSIKTLFLGYFSLYSVIFLMIMVLALFIIVMYSKRVEASYQNRLMELESITDGIAGGIAKIAYDGNFKLLYANAAFFDIFRYSRKEYLMNFGKNALACIHPADYIGIAKEFSQQSNRDELTMEFRAIDKNKKVHWILMRCLKQKTKSDKTIYQCVLTDVCKLKEIEETLLINNSRLQAVLEQSSDVIFEYNFETKLIEGIANWQAKRPLLFEELSKFLYELDIISADDLQLIYDLVTNCKNGFTQQNTRIQVKFNNKIRWYQVSLTTIFSKDNNPKLCILRMSDVDNDVKEKAYLIEQSQKESMTGLFNKKVGQELVSNYLQETKDACGALFMIDIDDFKLFNDNYGHIIGDKVILYVADCLKHLFRNEDITARIGGDEFLVFMKGCNDHNLINQKAQSIIDMMNQFQLENVDMRASVSIGIACAPNHGNSCEQLMKMADSMMYQTKKNGKGHYELIA